MKLATGLKMPSRGSIHIGGQPSPAAENQRMAFQAPTLLPGAPRWTTFSCPGNVEPYRSSFSAKRKEYEARRASCCKRRPGGYERQYACSLGACSTRVHMPRPDS